jgi:cytoskeleton protein RodZ
LNNEQQHELIPLKLGELLRQARRAKGLALEEIAPAIKVKPETLAALESGETDHIPSVYLKGYIRGYARYLDVPRSEVESRMGAARGSEPVVQTVFKEGLPRNPGERWIKASSYFVASAVVIALVWQFTNEAVRFSQGDPLLRPAQLDSRAAAAPAAGSSAETDTAGAAELPARTHLRASIASMNMSGEQAAGERPPVAEGAWAAIGNREPAAARPDAKADGPRTLEIITSADSWVEIVDRDGKKVEWDLLRAGSHRSYGGPEPLHLLLGRASSVEVLHNGRKIDLSPYTRGNVARLTLGAAADDPAGTGESAPQPAATDSTTPDQG